MAEMLKSVSVQSELGVAEARAEATRWKYALHDEDEVVIPKLGFNIEHHYATLEGKRFNKDLFEITKAYQKTAFLLNEVGAKVESKAEIETVPASAPMSGEAVIEEKPKPKRMRFDRPFFMMLKRTDNPNPYFGLWVVNSELMTKN